MKRILWLLAAAAITITACNKPQYIIPIDDDEEEEKPGEEAGFKEKTFVVNITLKDGVTKVDYGFVGDVKGESVNAGFIKSLLEMGITPVFCAINHDGRGNLLNTNADTIASSVAVALRAQLLYCFEKKGVLMDKDKDDSVIPHINPERFEELVAQGVVDEGMIPKIENALKALREGASSVVIRSASNISDNSGTLISL